jgi:hypothetical protein
MEVSEILHALFSTIVTVANAQPGLPPFST